MATQASIDTISSIGEKVVDKERLGRLRMYLTNRNVDQAVALIELQFRKAVNAGRIKEDEVEPLRRALNDAQAITQSTKKSA